MSEFRDAVRAILIDRASLDEHIGEFFEEVLDDIVAARPAADRDEAGVETRVRALAERYDHEADLICPPDTYDKKDKAWRVAHVRRRVAADLRAALSGPADAHPADGTST